MPLCIQISNFLCSSPLLSGVKLYKQVNLREKHEGCVTLNVLSRNSELRLISVTEKKIFPGQYFESR